MTRQLTLLYGVVAGLLSAIGVVVLLVTTGFANPGEGPRSTVANSGPSRITSPDLIILVAVCSLVAVAGLLAAGFYWRARSTAAHLMQEDVRRQREEVEKTLRRLRERMSLPSLVELNRIMLTEYHSIATNQAQKSFKSSQRAMLAGFTWLIACFTAAIFVGPLTGRIIAATMAPVGGVLAAYLGRTYLFVYNQALVQLSHYYSQPLLDSYYLAAERLTSEMSVEARDRLLGDVVGQLLAVAGDLSTGSARSSITPKRIRVRIPGMRPAPAEEDDSQGHPVMTTPSG